MTQAPLASWDPSLYLRFAEHRLRPALDLLARIDLQAAGDVVDLGCGAGNVTRALAERWPERTVTGVDSSPAMLAKARAAAPRVSFVEGDLAAWTPHRPPALLFSNAALHWVDDHLRLLPRLLGGLAPNGVLAVQVPHNHEAPSHRLVAEVAADARWSARTLPRLRDRPVAPPAAWFDWLAPVAAALEVWETEYLHALDGPDPVAGWLAGTTLRPLLDALAPGEVEPFMQEIAARARAAYPRRPDGRTLFPFKRLFVLARR